jgi:hypothetical protein
MSSSFGFSEPSLYFGWGPLPWFATFSVGITDMALRAADISRARVPSVNLEPAPKTGVRVLDVLGKTEELLPALV